MNWEGRIMLSRTSFFNVTLFRKNLARFWPLWGMASFFGAIFPLALLMQVVQNHSIISARAQFGLEMTEIYYNVVTFGVPLISLFYAILCAMCVWSYLYNARSVGCMHTLPIRREGLFVTNFLSGMTMMAIPYAITGALCVLVSLIVGGIHFKGLIVTILAVIGQSFFYFASATLVAFVTANIMALPVLYFIFHFLAPLMDMLISVFAQGFFFGYRGEYTGAVEFLSPTVYLMTKLDSHRIYDEGQQVIKPGTGAVSVDRVLTDVQLENGWIIAVYALVGLVMAAAAWLLYERRRSESAGEVVAVGWMKPIFRYGVSFCGALAGGQLLYALFWGMYQNGNHYDLLPLAICMAVAGAIGYYIASMLLAKSLRVFKGSWKGLGLVAASVAIVCGIMHFDLLGVERRIPDAKHIDHVEIRLNASDYINVDVSDADAIRQVQETHRAILAHKKELLERDENYWYKVDPVTGVKESYTHSSLRLTYVLKNGLEVERYYNVRYKLEEVEQPGTAVNALRELHSSPGVQYANLMGDLDHGRITGGELRYSVLTDLDPNGYPIWEWKLKNITAEQAEALTEAVRKDIAAGNFGRNAFDNEKWQQETYEATLSIYFKRIENGIEETWQSELGLQFSVNSTNLLAELERLGVIRRTDLHTEYEVYASEKYGKDYLTSFNPNSAPTVSEIISGAVTDSSVGIIGGADGPTAIYVTGG